MRSRPSSKINERLVCEIIYGTGRMTEIDEKEVLTKTNYLDTSFHLKMYLLARYFSKYQDLVGHLQLHTIGSKC